MEERSKVICHMMTTIDGKISIDWDGNEDYEKAGDAYDRLIFEYGEAFGCGRATLQTDDEVDFGKYKGMKVSYEDRVILSPKNTTLYVAFDRYGKLRPTNAYSKYAGHDTLALEVLTKKVKPEFLSYLNDIGIPYMFAGEEDFDPALFLRKLKKDYGVNTFVLCGGAMINAEFMRLDLVDEISIVMGPAVDGTRNSLTAIGTDNLKGFPKFFKLKNLSPLEGEGVLIQYKK